MRFEELVGKTITEITGANQGGEMITFTLDDGTQHEMYHDQSCCEHVRIEDINGDINDLIGSPITLAEERISSTDEDKPSEWSESWTWTFYTLATIKGYVTIRWLGESNGYYGEGVTFCELGKNRWD